MSETVPLLPEEPGSRRRSRGVPRPRLVPISKGVVFRIVSGFVWFLTLGIFVADVVVFLFNTETRAFYRSALLIPHCIFSGILIGTTADVSLLGLWTSAFLAVVALVVDVVLAVIEFLRAARCGEMGIPPEEAALCAEGTLATYILPGSAVALAALALISFIVLVMWANHWRGVLRSLSGFALRTTRESRITRDAQLLDKRADESKQRVSSTGLTVFAWIVLLLLLGGGLATMVGHISNIDALSFYRTPLLFVPMHIVALVGTALFYPSFVELVLAIVLAFIATASAAYGSYLEIAAFLRCDSGSPAGAIEDTICSDEPVLRCFAIVVHPVVAVFCLISIVLFIVWFVRTRRENRSRREEPLTAGKKIGARSPKKGYAPMIKFARAKKTS